MTIKLEILSIETLNWPFPIYLYLKEIIIQQSKECHVNCCRSIDSSSIMLMELPWWGNINLSCVYSALYCSKHSARIDSLWGVDERPHYLQLAKSLDLKIGWDTHTCILEPYASEGSHFIFPLFIFLQLYQDGSVETWPLLLCSVTSCTPHMTPASLGSISFLFANLQSCKEKCYFISCPG